MDEKVQNEIKTDQQNPEVENKEKLVTIDFKMVTFSLAGKDYAIDIMNVKEIAKGGHFTYVPNTAPFVLGVYNLRGDIIPIIDLRIFFNIEVTSRKNNEIENMIILTVEDKVFGIIVDAIDKVVGIQKSTIQPPHPLFGDINVKYIYGVVESNNKLFVLLDVDRIFTNKPREDGIVAEGDVPAAVASRVKLAAAAEGKSINEVLKNSYQAKTMLAAQNAEEKKEAKKETKQDVDLRFIAEGLAANKKFYVTDINKNWVKSRYESWEKEKAGGTTQITNDTDADAYLKEFYSQCTGSFWSKAYADAVYAALPDNSAKQIVVWNPGCGKGYESYSLACLLKKRYPDAKIKIFAQDMDLLNISNASMLSVPDNVASDWYSPYVTKGVTGNYGFSQEIKDSIMFEYHDCSHSNSVPSSDIIFCRDMLSFLAPEAQDSVLLDFEEKLKGNGIIILGENESLSEKINWSEKLIGNISVYSK